MFENLLDNIVPNLLLYHVRGAVIPISLRKKLEKALEMTPWSEISSPSCSNIENVLTSPFIKHVMKEFSVMTTFS